ncbi:hypothetical protein ACFWDQ_41135 [Streptomyces sp. NPDC060053]|uniref:hypothetical protein n=1 Tax=Streptomyces sp. NPDC060053 TaxID=3347047 RepID=UPI0036AADABD
MRVVNTYPTGSTDTADPTDPADPTGPTDPTDPTDLAVDTMTAVLSLAAERTP